MQLSALGAQKTRDESKKLQMYSRQWLPGDVLRVYYPLFWKDGQPHIACGAVWGHDVGDIKGLGLKTAFIPSTTQFDDNKIPIGTPDITYQFSKIAPIFISAMKAAEEHAIEAKKFPTEAGRKEALKKVEEKYDTKNNPEAIRPIIGFVKYFICTEVLSVKLTNDIPVDDTIAMTSAPLSGTAIRKLYSILNDPKYAPKEGDEFLEVEWRYPVDPKKSESGRAASPSGLTSEFKLETTFPASYTKVMSLAPSVSREAETIQKRATKMINPAKVLQAVTQYSIINSEYLDIITDEDEETLLNNIEVVKELGVVSSLTNQQLIEKINTALAEIDSAKMPDLSDAIPNMAGTDMPTNAAGAVSEAEQQLAGVSADVPDLSAGLGGIQPTPTVTEPTGQVQPTSNVVQQTTVPSGQGQQEPIPAGSPTIQQLMNSTDRVDDNIVEDIDLGGLV